MTSNTFSKYERLKHKKLIDQLFNEGKSFALPSLRVYFMQMELPYPNVFLQVGVSVSKRNFKKAVQRNRIKRLMRESVRLNKQDLEAKLINKSAPLAVFFLFTGKEMPGFEYINKKIIQGLDQLSGITDELGN